MIFRPFYYYDTGCAAYLFGCASKAKCAVVDAQERDIDAYIEFAAQKGMAITHVIDTHVHADHVSGGRLLADRVGAVYALHESAEVSFPFEKLHDGQVIELGNTTVKVLHTPGHSEESISLLVTDLRRGPEPWFVLTGDTLFTGSVGRPDLHARAREFAGKLHASLHNKLMTLPDDIEVYPGHFSGSVCGVGMSGKPSSTIGFEKRWNALLSKGRDEFIDAMSEVPPRPADMERILRLNRGTLETAA
jgi:glyoxylase-like metal-dependent hydrolase (beta-lactamase superfamily II)